MDYYKELNDYELLDLILENNEQAKELLIKKYMPIVKHLAIKYYKNNKNQGLELDDLVQEGIYAIFKAINTYKINKNIKFCTYVTACINRNIQTSCLKSKNKCYKILNEAFSYEVCEPNTNKEYSNVISDDSTEEPLNIMLNKNFYFELNKLKLDLDRELGEIFELRCNGFTYKEIAILLDIPVYRVARSIKQVKKEMKKRNLDQFLINN